MYSRTRGCQSFFLLFFATLLFPMFSSLARKLSLSCSSLLERGDDLEAGGTQKKRRVALRRQLWKSLGLGRYPA
jgi:hypothetical protein